MPIQLAAMPISNRSQARRNPRTGRLEHMVLPAVGHRDSAGRIPVLGVQSFAMPPGMGPAPGASGRGGGRCDPKEPAILFSEL